MPGFDATGPMGRGPQTGRGMGRCNESNAEINYGFGRFRNGRGRGFGRRMRAGQGFAQEMIPAQGPEDITAVMENRIAELEKRIIELEGKKDKADS